MRYMLMIIIIDYQNVKYHCFSQLELELDQRTRNYICCSLHAFAYVFLYLLIDLESRYQLLLEPTSCTCPLQGDQPHQRSNSKVCGSAIRSNPIPELPHSARALSVERIDSGATIDGGYNRRLPGLCTYLWGCAIPRERGPFDGLCIAR